MRLTAGLVAVPLVVLAVVLLSMSRREPVAAEREAMPLVIGAMPGVETTELAIAAEPIEPVERESASAVVEASADAAEPDFAAELDLPFGQAESSALPAARPALAGELRPPPAPAVSPDVAVEEPASDGLERYVVQEIHGREVREVTFVKMGDRWVRESVKRRSPPAAGSSE